MVLSGKSGSLPLGSLHLRPEGFEVKRFATRDVTLAAAASGSVNVVSDKPWVGIWVE
jgi:hypothetical protein